MGSIKSSLLSQGVHAPRIGETSGFQVTKGSPSRVRFSDPLTTLYGSVRPMLDKGHVILHFVAALPGEGTSTVARDFASLACKRGGRRTLLIDANTLNPTTARMFGCPTDHGILDDLREHRSLELALGSATQQGFWVGGLLGTPSEEALRPDEVRQAYAAFRDQVDLTVIDCAAIAGGNYADLMPEIASGVIMVIQAEATRPIVVSHAQAAVEQLGGNIVGAVLNRRKDYIPDLIYRYL